MSVGARDYIDKLLVEKYSQEKVDNHDADAMISRVSADDMMSAMNTSANHSRNMLLLSQRLSMVCYGVVARTARYTSSENAA